MPYRPLPDLLSPKEVSSLLDDKARAISLCNSQRESLHAAPSQSGFRVYCIILFTTPDKHGLQVVEGTNSEPGMWIGGSICAERAAICKLRFYTAPEIKVVFITSDAMVPIAPGILCREYLCGVCSPSWSPPPSVVMGDSRGERVITWNMEQIYPFPSLYRSIGRDSILAHGEAFVSRTKLPIWSDAGMHLIYEAALANNHRDGNLLLHPLSLSAAVLFEDGSVSIAWQLKGLEFGCSLDPVSQLINTMVTSLQRPRFLVQVDQLGIAHAPFGQARALLVEHGFACEPMILVHNTTDGTCLVLSPASLAPHPPDEAASVDAHMISTNSSCGAR